MAREDFSLWKARPRVEGIDTQDVDGRQLLRSFFKDVPRKRWAIPVAKKRDPFIEELARRADELRKAL